MKKFRLFLLLLSVALVLVSLVACDGGGTEPCTAHTDLDENGTCDTCGEAICQHADVNNDKICDVCRITLEEKKVDVTFTVLDEAGAPVEGAEFTLNQDDEAVFTLTTDAQGKATCQALEGRYLIIFTSLPENWYSNNNYSNITVSQGTSTFQLDAIDNTPNGSLEKPYPSENAETGLPTSVTISAGQKSYFSTKGTARYLVINNAGLKVIYKNSDYLPSADGEIRVLIDSTEATTVTLFQIENTTDSDILVTLAFETVPGTQENPHVAELDTVYEEQVLPEESVYYELTVTNDGVLMASSDSELNDIGLYNKTTYELANSTRGKRASYMVVKAGDVIRVSISTTTKKSGLGQATEKDTINMRLSLFEGTELDPIVVYESATITFKANQTYYFKYEGQNGDVVVNSSDVEFSLAGRQTTKNDTGLSISTGDTFAIENKSATAGDIIFNVILPEEE
ncbi:MAG: carboxypeptidase regulatory-like domain-containing protein [Clostridia bacterium]|nr:carboxypeptidase regulatory-like domain-containing protein [Clostridia bacterium]